MLDIEVKKKVYRYVVEDGTRIGEIEIHPVSEDVVFSPYHVDKFTIDDLERIISEMKKIC